MFLCRVPSRAIRLPLTSALQASRSFTTTHRILYSEPVTPLGRRTGAFNYNPGTISVGTLPIISWTASESQHKLLTGYKRPDTPVKCEAYPWIRERNKRQLAKLPQETWLSVAHSAVLTGNETIANLLVDDVIHHGVQLRTTAASVLSILISAPEKLLFSSPTLLRVAVFFRTYEQFFSDVTQSRLSIHYAATLTRHSPVGPSNSRVRRLRLYMLPVLRHQLNKLPHAPEPPTAQYALPPLAQAAMVVATSCLRWGLDEPAKDILLRLSKANMIPVHVRRRLHDTESFTEMRLVMIATALHWNLRLLAVYVARDILSRDIPPASLDSVVAASMEILRALLEHPNDLSLRSCSYMIRRVHPLGAVPGKYITDFYRAAIARNLGEAVQFVYAWSREPEVMHACHYPPPPPELAVFLLNRLERHNSQAYLHRTLIQDFADEDQILPRSHRVAIITTAADKGYAMAARRMWERHADGEDKEVVVGNGALMMKMVSLFYDLTNRAKHVLDYRHKDPILRNKALLNDSVMVQRATDLENFTNRIIDEYIAAHSPLSEAHHYVLTTLARAYMVVGKFVDGFGALRQLVDRQEMLDMTDVNVALSGLAEQHPSMAAGILKRMRARSIYPDETMLGTILHAARLHKDREIVDAMVQELQELSQQRDKPLTSATVTSVLLAYADPVNGLDSTLPLVIKQARSKLRKNLRAAWDFLSNVRLRKQERIAYQTGKQLVLSALRARDPVLAFDFWDKIIVGASHWDDREHQFLRELIAEMVESEMKEQKLDEKTAMEMLRPLRSEPQPSS
ncbi:hypothetical protein EV714DRAFT_242026 [Schizophyllum commune]